MGEYILGKVKRFYTNHPCQENIIQIFQQGVAPDATPVANRVKGDRKSQNDIILAKILQHFLKLYYKFTVCLNLCI